MKKSISRIGFKNVRVFKNQQWFDLAPITVLTGKNNSGKSTIQKILLIISNSFKIRDNNFLDIESLIFANSLEVTGGFYSNLSYNSKSKSLVLSFTFDDELFGTLDAYLTYEKNKYLESGRLTEIEIKKNDERLLLCHSLEVNTVYKDDPMMQDDYFKSLHENRYLWNFSEEWHFKYWTFVDQLYDMLLKSKNKGYNQDKVVQINNKIAKNIELSKEEKLLKEEHEANGAIFNSEAAEELSIEMEEGGYYNYPKWNIWNIHTKSHYEFIEYNKEISEIFHQDVESLLIPSGLSELVLGDADLLNNEQNDVHLRFIKQELKENNILDKEKFIECYQEFEKLFILYTIKSLNNNNKYFRETQFSEIDPKSFKDFFNPLDDNYDYKNILELIAEKNIIAKLILAEIPKSKNVIPASTMANMFPDRFVGKKSKEEKSEELHSLVFVYNELIKSITKPVNGLINALDEFTKRLFLSNYNKTIKRHFLFADLRNINSPFLEFGIKYLNSNEKKYKLLQGINFWIQEFKIGEELIIEEIKTSSETIGVSYFIKKNKKVLPLSDNGLGINNLIMLLLNRSLAMDANHQPILALEEPEIHLHPKYQSMLAEVFVKHGQYIIETHSEYLIRKLQNLTAKEKIKPEDTAVYYFNDPNDIPKGEMQVKKLTIREDGMMDDDFGPGFLDESISLTIDLLKNQKSN